MRSLIAPSALIACLAAVAVLAQDEKKHELIYRWDQLDGKIAIYDNEVTTLAMVDRRTTTDQTDDKSSIETADTKMESTSTTKQRLAMSFKAGDGGRGLVTVSNARLQTSLVQKALGETTRFDYDSADPPKEGVPEKFKALVGSLLGKPYTLTVSRRGVVEKVEGRPKSDMPKLKSSFLLFPDVAATESSSWNEVRRHPSPPLGDLVERIKFRLVKVNEKDERRIEQTIETELDDAMTKVERGTIVRLDNPKGKGHVVFDARGLKLEEETEQGYELYVKQFAGSVEQKTKVVAITKWKLVEVKSAQ